MITNTRQVAPAKILRFERLSEGLQSPCIQAVVPCPVKKTAGGQQPAGSSNFSDYPELAN
jgi:hypothetical protein